MIVTILENHNHRICRLCNKKIDTGLMVVRVEQSTYYQTLQSSFHLSCFEKIVEQGKKKIMKEKIKREINEEIKKLKQKLKEIDKK